MSGTTTVLPAGLEALSADRFQATTKSKELGQEEFFKLMITQLKNQDPMNPMENGEFLSQIAQFSTVNGITELQKSFTTLAGSLQSSQALQASTMVGRSVLLATNVINLGADMRASGAVELDQPSSEVVLTVYDGAGQIVKQMNLGGHEAGLVPFTWSGVDEAGAGVPAGNYYVTAQALFAADGPQAVNTLANLKVESVTIPGAGEAPVLNLANRQQVLLSDVRQVM